MRFMTRSLLGLGLLGLTLAILGIAAGNIFASVKERDARSARQRPAEERVFPVTVDSVVLTSVAPTITAFGEIESWRELELRSAAGGTLIEISDAFRDGGFVTAGDLLFQIDPADAQAGLDLAATQVKEAEAEVLEAKASLDLAKAELVAAEEQEALRQGSLARSEGLKSRGVGSDAAVETAEIALSSAQQTVLARRQALAQAEARILRSEIGLEREEIALAEATRRLDETSFEAPFDGVLGDIAAVTGRQVSANEKLGVLIDPSALEVAFRVSNAQFSRLVDELGALRQVDVTATLDLDSAPITVNGTLDRAGAQVGEGQTGRLLYARLDFGKGQTLRPGDFMTVEIREPALQNVAVVPATAATSAGKMLLVGDGDRLEAVDARILRRQADTLIVAGLSAGRDYVLRLQPQLGPGVKVKPTRPGGEIVQQVMVTLEPERRAKLVAALEANTRMPASVRDRMLARLQEDEVPEDMVNRLEARMGGRGGQAGGDGSARPAASNDATIALAPERRAALLAFVEGNDRMPADRKQEMLEQLRAEAVPAALVERLEGRMGGAGATPATTAASNDMVSLDPARRDALLAFVEGNDRMPADRKAGVLEQLRADMVPVALVQRLEERLGNASSEETAAAQPDAIDGERRARLITFVEANEGMPVDVKARILLQLQSDNPPADLVSRIEAQMPASTRTGG